MGSGRHAGSGSADSVDGGGVVVLRSFLLSINYLSSSSLVGEVIGEPPWLSQYAPYFLGEVEV